MARSPSLRGTHVELGYALVPSLAQNAKAPVFLIGPFPDTLDICACFVYPHRAHMRKAADVFRYNRKVSIAPPWSRSFNKIRNASRSSMKPSAPTLRWSKTTNRWTTNCWNCRGTSIERTFRSLSESNFDEQK